MSKFDDVLFEASPSARNFSSSRSRDAVNSLRVISFRETDS
jgi:hypothetical protein